MSKLAWSYILASLLGRAALHLLTSCDCVKLENLSLNIQRVITAKSVYRTLSNGAR